MGNNNNWLPPLIECSDLSKYKDYESQIYDIFYEDYIKTENFFLDKKVIIRRNPKKENKLNGFWHYICGHELENPDLNRCSRIRWAKVIINKIAEDKANIRKLNLKIYFYEGNYHILLVRERFLVVIEVKKNYAMLVSAIYLDQNRKLKNKLDKYELYKIAI